MSAKGLKFSATGFTAAEYSFSRNDENTLQNLVNKQGGFEVYHRNIDTTTECIPVLPSGSPPGAGPSTSPIPSGGAEDASDGSSMNQQSEEKQSASATKLHALIQHIYAAQARVQLEATEIKKAQGVASSAQKSLEEAANNVRIITAALQAAQQEVATAAVRAQTAQMQLAAHDQLLFAARQKVDALSSQMVGLQAEDGVGVPKPAVNMQALLDKLKEPLPQKQTPTAIPPVDVAPGGGEAKPADKMSADENEFLSYDYRND